MSPSEPAAPTWRARAANYARQLSALVCLVSAYLFAETEFATRWLVVSAVAALIVATAPSQWAAPQEGPALPWPTPGELWRSFLPGWGLMLLATVLKIARFSPQVILWVWLAGTLWLLVGAWLLSRPHVGAVTPRSDRRWAWVFGVLIVTFAAGLRLWAIDQAPRYIHVDEGTSILLALDVYARPDRDWFGPGASHTAANMTFCFMLLGWGAWLFGFNLTAARLPDVVLGILSIALTFDGLRRVSNLRVAAVGALLLATNHCHIAFSRIASSYIQTAFVVSYLMAIFSRVWMAPTYFNSALLGIGAALGIQTYFPGLMSLPLLVTVMGLLWVLNPGRRRALLSPLLIFAISCAAAAAPFVVGILQHNAEMLERPAMVNIFSPMVMESLKRETYHTDSTAVVLAHQTWNALRAFHVGEDKNPQYGIWLPMADRYTAALMIPGAVLVLLALRQFLAANALVFTVGYLWLALAMQKSIGFNRVTGALPFAMTVPAIALAQCFGTLWGERRQWTRGASNLCVAAAVALCAAANLQIYFGEYGRWLFFGDEVSEAGWAARQYAKEYTVYLIDWTETREKQPVHDGLRLILGSLNDSERSRVHLTPATSEPLTEARTAVVEGNTLFVVWSQDTAARDAILARFPHARIEPRHPPKRDSIVDLIFVSPSDATQSRRPATALSRSSA